ncbi:class I SAM-dependent methyltransferase [Chloroflexota bacterium]
MTTNEFTDNYSAEPSVPPGDELNPLQKIEIISIDILDHQRIMVDELKQLANSLKLEFGWHYLLDLTWIINELGVIKGKEIMDAGAGIGVMQWYLANHNVHVFSVDRESRADLPLRFRSNFYVDGLRKSDLLPSIQVVANNFKTDESNIEVRSPSRRLIKFGRDLLTCTRLAFADNVPIFDNRGDKGRVTIYNQDLKHLGEIEDNILDAVVAVSALEHNTPDGLVQVVQEMMRVLKPGGVLLASLNAARDQDWWHKASSGWCYTDTSLRKIFDLPSHTPSNFDQYDKLFTALQNSTELRTNLARFYFQSGDNGMPWGKWDPKYQPLGICKVKGSQDL